MMILGLFTDIMLLSISCMFFKHLKIGVSADVRFVVDGAESELGILDLIQVRHVHVLWILS